MAVVITGFASQFIKEELARHEYIMKPARPAELPLAVRRHIGE